MVDSFAQVAFEYATYPGGTPPFVTTMDFVTSEPVDDTNLTELVTACQSGWNDQITVFIDNQLGGGSVTAKAVYLDIVFEASLPLDDGGDGAGAAMTPGTSYRAIKGSQRPSGGKPGCMYLPQPRTDGVNADGTLKTASLPDLNDALGNFLTDLNGATDWSAVVRRKVGGDTFTTFVSSLFMAPTVSFLRKRYR